MKTISRYIMTLALLLTAVTGAWAQTQWESGDCTVTLNNGTLTVSGNGGMADYLNYSDRPWDGNKGDITSVVVESGVTSVGFNAFSSFSTMTSVTLPEGLTAIGPNAFNSCSSLQSITIPSTVTSISEGAFYGCSAMTSVTLPEGLTAIGGMTFSDCISLTSVTIPSTVTSIEDGAFMGCSAITSVTLPEGLTAIGAAAFMSCSSLTSVTIPSTVTSIRDNAFVLSSAISDVNLYANPDNLTWGDASSDFKSGKATQCHVLAEHLTAYETKFGSSVNVTFVGDLQPLATPIKVTPGSSANTWTFTMPGSDVVLTPIYAKAAAFATTGTEPEVKTLLPEAAEGVIAGTDASLIAEGTGIVAFAGTSTEVTQGTLMYAIGTSATEAPALTAFSATVPTAKNVADDGADVYVWYYIKGADAPDGQQATEENTFNDTEPACLTVTVLTNKFDITFKAANDNTIEAGKATVTVDDQPATVTEGKLEGVKMGSEVKLEAKPGYKFRKVEVKKAEAAGIVNPVVGQVIGSDGNNYDANATLPDGVTKVAMIAYVSGSNGLALALTDISGYYTWDNSGTSNNGKTAPEICSALNTSMAVTGGTWKLPSQDEWKQMFSANGGNEGSYTGLNTAIGNAGGTALNENGEYWSSSEFYDDAWLVRLEDGNASWSVYGKHYTNHVRACLAF
ncbi:leucine-rich repeat domain-containing protein [Prevotella sp. E9-3]|uniref:leucine-rich repeat protein n=1 Tax=Prevotella sp. E9-3 TaxID=2913621 RepID=UPI001EDB730F|nr:leucine-rich repeat protein [Prevotella sp. E9-3]UKK49631.1 leucine-rich repeat domain-containing protein [Prevotella sp. E9-3]